MVRLGRLSNKERPDEDSSGWFLILQGFLAIPGKLIYNYMKAYVNRTIRINQRFLKKNELKR